MVRNLVPHFHYTCPGYMCVPRKSWRLGNEYHSICCFISGLLHTIKLVEGKDCPRQKPAEKFSDVAKSGTSTSLLLCLCESIFHTGMVVILNSGFCVLRATIELKKRGMFASALTKSEDIGQSIWMGIRSTVTLLIKMLVMQTHCPVEWAIFPLTYLA